MSVRWSNRRAQVKSGAMATVIEDFIFLWKEIYSVGVEGVYNTVGFCGHLFLSLSQCVSVFIMPIAI